VDQAQPLRRFVLHQVPGQPPHQTEAKLTCQKLSGFRRAASVRVLHNAFLFRLYLEFLLRRVHPHLQAFQPFRFLLRQRKLFHLSVWLLPLLQRWQNALRFPIGPQFFLQLYEYHKEFLEWESHLQYPRHHTQEQSILHSGRTHHFYNHHPLVRFRSCMQPIDACCRKRDCCVKSECNNCLIQIIIDGLWYADYA